MRAGVAHIEEIGRVTCGFYIRRLNRVFHPCCPEFGTVKGGHGLDKNKIKFKANGKSYEYLVVSDTAADAAAPVFAKPVSRELADSDGPTATS